MKKAWVIEMKEIRRKTFEGVPSEIEKKFYTIENEYICGRQDVDLYRKRPEGLRFGTTVFGRLSWI